MDEIPSFRESELYLKPLFEIFNGTTCFTKVAKAQECQDLRQRSKLGEVIKAELDEHPPSLSLEICAERNV